MKHRGIKTYHLNGRDAAPQRDDKRVDFARRNLARRAALEIEITLYVMRRRLAKGNRERG